MGKDLNLDLSDAKNKSEMSTILINELRSCGFPENSEAYKKATAYKIAKKRAIQRTEIPGFGSANEVAFIYVDKVLTHFI